MKKIILILASILFFTTLSHAESEKVVSNNNNALKGLKEAKAYFDVTVGNPKILLIRLQLIEKTHNQLVTAGVKPNFVIGIRGKASSFFTKGTDYVIETDLPEKEQIAALVKRLKTQNIVMEQCLIAAGFEGIDVADFLPQVELVANGYISMIGYQAQGYSLVPMD